MILNEGVNAIFSECLLYGAPNETVTLLNIDTGEEKEYLLNEKGEIFISKLHYGLYFLTGTKSKEALPDGRIAYFDNSSKDILIDGIQHRILSVYPENTWFWFGKTFGEWKGTQYTPGSKPFTENTYYQDEKIKETTSLNLENGCLKIYSQSSKKNKAYGWSGNIQLIKKPGNCNRICFLAKATLEGSKTKEATVGLGFNIKDSTKTDIGNLYNFFLQAQVGKEKDIYMADVSRYRDLSCMPVAFIANDSTKDETIVSSSLEIYAIWMDELIAEGSGETEKVKLAVSWQTLRSEILAMAGRGWHNASMITDTGENFVGRSVDWNGSGQKTNSSMAVPLTFDFSGISKNLKMTCLFYLPYAPWECYWAISTNLDPYRAKDTNQAINGIFPEVTNDDGQLARGTYVFNESLMKMEFPCNRIPKNTKFYLILYTKYSDKIGAIHARGTLEAWVEYGVDR